MKLKTILVIFACFAVLSTALTGYFYFQSAKKIAVENIHSQANEAINVIAGQVNSVFSERHKITESLAGIDVIKKALQKPDREELDQANQTLQYFQQSLGAQVLYLMQPDGTTIASSNASEENSFVGKNYRFRQYFTDAMLGGSSTDFALGVTSGERGIYTGKSVRSEKGTILGVLVAKENIFFIQNAMRSITDGEVVLCSPEGVVFVASSPDHLYKSLWQISPAEQESIINSKRFGNQPISWAGYTKTGHHTATNSDGTNFITHSAEIRHNPGWKILFFHNNEEVLRSVVQPLYRSVGLVASLLCLLVIASSFALYQKASLELKVRKAAEEDLRNARAHFQRLFEFASDVFLIIKPDGQIVDVNQKAEKTLGYTREELVQLNIETVEIGSFKDQVYDLSQANEAGKKSRAIGQHRRKDGTTFPVEISLGLFQDEPQLLVAVARDISERVHAQGVLENRIVTLTQPHVAMGDIKFEELFNLDDIQKLQDEFSSATEVASMITDSSGNPVTRPSNFSRYCNDLVRNTEKGLANCFRTDISLGRISRDGPNIQRCASGGLWDAGAAITIGGKHIATWMIGQVRDESQSEEGIRAYARQIGADEDELVKAFFEIPVMSSERFQSIADALYTLANQLSSFAFQNIQQARFIEERKSSEKERLRLSEQVNEKNREMEQVVYVTSHDLRSPLVSIEGFSGMLESTLSDLLAVVEKEPLTEEGQASYELLSEECRESIGFIRKGVSSMGALLNGLLQFSRLGRIEIKKQHVDMTRMMTRLLDNFRIQIDQQQADVTTTELPACHADEEQLYQLFSNLISNALKYTHDVRKAEIRITGHTEEDRSVYSVADNGPGIADQFKNKIFEMFHQLDSGADGEGLGLSIVYRIVERHGGKIWVESEEGEGCRFYISLEKSKQTLS